MQETELCLTSIAIFNASDESETTSKSFVSCYVHRPEIAGPSMCNLKFSCMYTLEQSLGGKDQISSEKGTTVEREHSVGMPL